MTPENIMTLKEIASLTESILKFGKNVEAELERINTVKSLKKKRQLELDKLSKQKGILISETEVLEERLEDRIEALEKLELNQRYINTLNEEKKFTAQKNALTDQVQLLEQKVLEMLESLDQINSQIEEIRNFLGNIDNSIKVIEDDTQLNTTPLQQKILNSNDRIKYLFSTLPADISNRLKALLKKKLTYGPFTRIDSGHCHICRVQFYTQLVIQVEEKKEFRCCTQCSRIILPS